MLRGCAEGPVGHGTSDDPWTWDRTGPTVVRNGEEGGVDVQSGVVSATGECQGECPREVGVRGTPLGSQDPTGEAGRRETTPAGRVSGTTLVGVKTRARPGTGE